MNNIIEIDDYELKHFPFNYETVPISPKQDKKDKLAAEKRSKLAKADMQAGLVVKKFLEENPTVNVGYVIEHLQSTIVSTTQCCSKLGISPGAFLRLRKKYNIDPVYSLKNTEKDLLKSKKNIYNRHFLNKFAIKNFYNPKQLEVIPQSDIELVQLRAARSLKFPNGENVGWKWTQRGFHPNGKIRARINFLEKQKIRVYYIDSEDKYRIMLKGYEDKKLSRQEIDKLNFKYKKLAAFI